jgi:uncharacterized protein (DUF2164 family)
MYTSTEHGDLSAERMLGFFNDRAGTRIYSQIVVLKKAHELPANRLAAIATRDTDASPYYKEL